MQVSGLNFRARLLMERGTVKAHVVQSTPPGEHFKAPCYKHPDRMVPVLRERYRPYMACMDDAYAICSIQAWDKINGVWRHDPRDKCKGPDLHYMDIPIDEWDPETDVAWDVTTMCEECKEDLIAGRWK